MTKMFQDHSAGVVGTGGFVIGKSEIPDGVGVLIPNTPAEWLIFLSTLLVILQLGHYGWRFYRFLKGKKHNGSKKTNT